MDHSRFRLRTVVDWIEIEILTVKPTHFDAIKRHAALSYVDPTNAEPEGKSATVFRFKIYDPKNWQSIVSTVGQIKEKFDLVKPFEIVGVEVALDAYSRTGNQLECAALVAHFAKFSTHTHENRRLYRKKGEPSFALPSVGDSLVRNLIEGYQIGVGDKDAECYQHAYFKTTDKGEAIADRADHRARLEITLRGNQLPCRTQEQWSRYKFADLAKPYFSFRELRTDLSPLAKVTADANMQIGKRCKRNLNGIGTRLFSRLTIADSTLNGIARDKLRDLSDRWQTQKKMTCTNGQSSMTAEIRGNEPPAMPVVTQNQPRTLLTTQAKNNHQHDSTSAVDNNQGKEAHSADCTISSIIEPESLRSSRLDGNEAAMTPEMLRISRLIEITDDDEAHSADVASFQNPNT